MCHQTEFKEGLVYRTAHGSEPTEVEVRLLEQLQLSIATPKARLLSPKTMVYPMLRGQPLMEATPSIARELAHFLFELHDALPLDKARALGLGEFDWPLLPKTLAESVPPLLQLNETRNIFNEFIKEYVVEEPTVLAHNDIHPPNLLVEEGHLVGVIDFTQACVGEPYLDFRYLPLLGRAFFKECFRIYSLLCQRGLAIKRAESYYLATEFSIIVEQGGSLTIEERLIHWRAVCQL